jgi:hypothetical protein
MRRIGGIADFSKESASIRPAQSRSLDALDSISLRSADLVDLRASVTPFLRSRMLNRAVGESLLALLVHGLREMTMMSEA